MTKHISEAEVLVCWYSVQQKAKPSRARAANVLPRLTGGPVETRRQIRQDRTMWLNANQELTPLLMNAVVCITADGKQSNPLALCQLVTVFVWSLLCQMDECSGSFPKPQEEGRWETPLLNRTFWIGWDSGVLGWGQWTCHFPMGVGSVSDKMQSRWRIIWSLLVNQRCQVDYRYFRLHVVWGF